MVVRNRTSAVQTDQRGSDNSKHTKGLTLNPQPAAAALRRLLHWDELPLWQRDNHHIHTGYRPASNSFAVSFHSLTYVHNETVNIYTHLLPALCCVPVAVL